MRGIYKITNPIGEVYVGQSKDIERRRYQYSISSARKQTLLQNSLNIHGWSSHNFEILFHMRDDVSQENLNYWEVFFIKYFLDSGSPMLNMKHGGAYGVYSSEVKAKMSQIAKNRLSNPLNNSFFGKKHSKESKEKMRKAKLGKPVSEGALKGLKSGWEKNKFPKKIVLQSSLTGEFIREWESLTEAAQHFNITIGSLSTACSKEGRTSCGYRWKYK